MTISGLKIFKMLPGGKKEKEANCKQCGFPTCMAFAMKLAKGEASIDKCEYITEDLKQLLNSESNKFQKELTFGLKEKPLKIGGEKVLYRHDKTFINPTCISIKVKINNNQEDTINKINEITDYTVERVGESLQVTTLAIEDTDQNLTTFIQTIKDKNLHKKLSLILISNNTDQLINSANLITKQQTPILLLKNAESKDYINLSKKTNCPIIVQSDTIDNLISLISELEKNKIENIIINPPKNESINPIEILTLIRRGVINNNIKELRYPIITLSEDDCNTNNIIEEGIKASSLICKYSNLVVINNFDPAIIYALFTLRQNIFTNPQQPLQIEPKLYEIGEVNAESPLIVTTNFALTYFTVAGEVESSNVPCYVLITPSDGMSVLTAWAANKFNGPIISKAIKESKIEEKINHRTIIISGYVSTLKEEIEEDLPGWTVQIAPNEASEIPDYLANNLI